MTFSIALAQIQLPPQYHPDYSASTSRKPGDPSPLRARRKEQLHAIGLEMGRALHGAILVAMREADPKVHKDDVRKMLEELCEDGRMDRQVTSGSGGKRVWYTAMKR